MNDACPAAPALSGNEGSRRRVGIVHLLLVLATRTGTRRFAVGHDTGSASRKPMGEDREARAARDRGDTSRSPRALHRLDALFENVDIQDPDPRWLSPATRPRPGPATGRAP